MNTAFYSDPVERNIVEEIMQWSSKALQKPNSFFNQLFGSGIVATATKPSTKILPNGVNLYDVLPK